MHWLAFSLYMITTLYTIWYINYKSTDFNPHGCERDRCPVSFLCCLANFYGHCQAEHGGQLIPAQTVLGPGYLFPSMWVEISVFMDVVVDELGYSPLPNLVPDLFVLSHQLLWVIVAAK